MSTKNYMINEFVRSFSDKEIIFSYSFFSKWKSDCKFKAFIDFIYRPKGFEEDGRNFLVGEVFHKLFEQWYKNGDFNFDWLKDNAKQFYIAGIKNGRQINWNSPYDKKQLFIKLMRLINNQIEIINKEKLIQKYYLTEAKFSIKEKNYNIIIKGFVDLILLNSDKNELYILDYKSQTNKTIDMEQLMYYAFGYRFIYKNLSAYLSNIFPDFPDKLGIILPHFKIVEWRKISKQILDEYIKNNLKPIIKDVRETISSCNIDYNKKCCYSYGRVCIYKDYCPAHAKNFENLIKVNESAKEDMRLNNYFKTEEPE